MRKFVDKDLAEWLSVTSQLERTRFSKLYHAIDDASDLTKLAPLIEGEMLLDCDGGFAIPIRDNYQNVVGSIKAIFSDGDMLFTFQRYN